MTLTHTETERRAFAALDRNRDLAPWHRFSAQVEIAGEIARRRGVTADHLAAETASTNLPPAFALLGPTALASEPGEHATAALAEADRTPTPEPSR